VSDPRLGKGRRKKGPGSSRFQRTVTIMEKGGQMGGGEDLRTSRENGQRTPK